MMKKVICLCISILLLLPFGGCNKLLGGSILKMFGMEFTSQVEMIEECLAIDLDNLQDDSIKTINEETSSEGKGYSIQYIDCEGGGDLLQTQVVKSEKWQSLPLPEKIEGLLEQYNVHDAYDFSGIKEGYWVLSGVSEEGMEFDFAMKNFDLWDCYEIGIWDTNDETLYFISITV